MSLSKAPLHFATVLTMVSLGLNATAQAFDEGSDVGAPKVQYLSWCVQNTVVELDVKGNPVEKYTCEDHGLQCHQEERFAGPLRVITAYCR